MTLSYPVPDLFANIKEPSSYFSNALHEAMDDNGNRLPSIIVLSGPCGTGKTHDACGWMNYIRKAQGFGVGYIKASDVWALTVDELHTLTMRHVLCIDDYGQKRSIGNLERIGGIVDRRMESVNRYTIITTNVLSEIDNIDERLASRLNTGALVQYDNLPDRRKEA